jgi:hypothetical protein
MGRRSDGSRKIENITWHTIRIEYDSSPGGRGAKEFQNVHELATFLKVNPEFAERLGHVVKVNYKKDENAFLVKDIWIG